MTTLDERVAVLETRLEAIDKAVLEIRDDLHAIREKMATYRPPWSVVALITFLTSLTVGLVVKLIG